MSEKKNGPRVVVKCPDGHYTAFTWVDLDKVGYTIACERSVCDHVMLFWRTPERDNVVERAMERADPSRSQNSELDAKAVSITEALDILMEHQTVPYVIDEDDDDYDELYDDESVSLLQGWQIFRTNLPSWRKNPFTALMYGIGVFVLVVSIVMIIARLMPEAPTPEQVDADGDHVADVIDKCADSLVSDDWVDADGDGCQDEPRLSTGKIEVEPDPTPAPRKAEPPAPEPTKVEVPPELDGICLVDKNDLQNVKGKKRGLCKYAVSAGDALTLIARERDKWCVPGQSAEELYADHDLRPSPDYAYHVGINCKTWVPPEERKP